MRPRSCKSTLPLFRMHPPAECEYATEKKLRKASSVLIPSGYSEAIAQAPVVARTWLKVRTVVISSGTLGVPTVHSCSLNGIPVITLIDPSTRMTSIASQNSMVSAHLLRAFW